MRFWPQPKLLEKPLSSDVVEPQLTPLTELDIRSGARRGALPDQLVEGEELLQPIPSYRFRLANAASQRVRESIQQAEDSNIFRALTEAANNRQFQTESNANWSQQNSFFDLPTLSAAYRQIDPVDFRPSIITGGHDTDEGRAALAQSMVEPIRRSLDYQSVGRRLLMVDDLQQEVLPYFRDGPVARQSQEDRCPLIPPEPDPQYQSLSKHYYLDFEEVI